MDNQFEILPVGFYLLHGPTRDVLRKIDSNEPKTFRSKGAAVAVQECIPGGDAYIVIQVTALNYAWGE